MTAETIECPVERLVRKSHESTLHFLEEQRSVPLTIGTDPVSLFKLKEALHLLECFPILDTRDFTQTQIVELSINQSNYDHSRYTSHRHPEPFLTTQTELPLYAMYTLKDLEKRLISMSYVRVFENIQTHTFGTIEYSRFLGLKLGAVASFNAAYREKFGFSPNGEDLDGCVVPIKVPKDVVKIADSLNEFGFKNYSVVWGPVEYSIGPSASNADPLLVGFKNGRWWILHRWGVTPSEQKLIVPD